MGMISGITLSIKGLQDVKLSGITLRLFHISLSMHLSASIFLFISNFCHLIIRESVTECRKIQVHANHQFSFAHEI